jgi:UDPglucose 6-dehydrogenase
MIGTGYVGLVSGTCFADIGHTVYCVDKDEKKIDKLNSGISPIYEPGLDELIKENSRAKRLFFTTNLSYALNKSDIIFICVGTPNKKKSLSVDLSYVFKVSKEIKKFSKNKKIIVTKSTVPVGTGDLIDKLIKNKKKFTILSNPEFLREGEAIRDFRYPDRIVIGSNSPHAFKIMKNLYLPLINKGAKFFTTNRRGAELIKYASNAFLATKITFINEIANLCEKTGINIEDISLGMGSDVRIGSRFLRAGPASQRTQKD